MEEIEAARRRCARMIDRVERLPRHTNITDSSRRTLLKLAVSELNFLSRASSATPLCVNIGHLESVVHLLEQPFVTGVSRVCKPVPPYSCAITKGVHVDIVCSLNKKPVWIIVSDRNPKCVSWVGNVHKVKGLRERLEEVLVAARGSLVMKPTSIVLFFSHGIVDSVFEKLRDEFGASDMELEFLNFDYDFCEELGGEWVNVITRSYNEARLIKIDVDDSSSGIFGSKCGPKDLVVDRSELEFIKEDSKLDLGNVAFCSLVSSMEPWSSVEDEELDVPENLRGDDDVINFTTTAMIALVSGISNGCTEKLLATPETELRQKFKGNLEFVIGQVKSEIQSPMLIDCGRIISGKRAIVCETVLSEFKELISMYGGPNEKFRAGELLKHLRIVPDTPSERMMGLPTTRNLALKNKVVFGTGDYWHATTLTANMAFVRAVSQTGMSLVTIEHSPRALIGD